MRSEKKNSDERAHVMRDRMGVGRVLTCIITFSIDGGEQAELLEKSSLYEINEALIPLQAIHPRGRSESVVAMMSPIHSTRAAASSDA